MKQICSPGLEAEPSSVSMFFCKIDSGLIMGSLWFSVSRVKLAYTGFFGCRGILQHPENIEVILCTLIISRCCSTHISC